MLTFICLTYISCCLFLSVYLFMQHVLFFLTASNPTFHLQNYRHNFPSLYIQIRIDQVPLRLGTHLFFLQRGGGVLICEVTTPWAEVLCVHRWARWETRALLSGTMHTFSCFVCPKRHGLRMLQHWPFLRLNETRLATLQSSLFF